MDIKSLLIQGLGILGTVAYLLSYQFKRNKDLFRMQFISSIFYGLHFFFLGAYTGALSSMITLLRAFCLSSDNKILRSKGACIIVCTLQVLFGIITFEGYYSFFPMIANISLTITGYTNNPEMIRFAGMCINSPLWIVYDVIVGSWAGVIDELITEASIITSIFRYKFNDEEDIIK